jgi:conjugal transfer/entry exclusion protein
MNKLIQQNANNATILNKLLKDLDEIDNEIIKKLDNRNKKIADLKKNYSEIIIMYHTLIKNLI